MGFFGVGIYIFHFVSKSNVRSVCGCVAVGVCVCAGGVSVFDGLFEN